MMQGRSGNEGTSDTKAALADLLLPHGLQVYTNRGKNRHVQNGEKIFGKILGRIELYRNAAKAEIEHAGAPSTLFAKNSVGVRAGHGNALGLALDGKNARRGRGEFRGRRY
jgi:hypothetical protein